MLAYLETGHVNLLKECPSCGACDDAPAATCASDGVELQLSLPVERTIDGTYRLDRLIGQGGMGPRLRRPAGAAFRGRTHSDLLTAIMNEPFTLGGEGAERRCLESVLQRALASDASARYSSVAELARALLPALRALPSIDAASCTDQQTTIT